MLFLLFHFLVTDVRADLNSKVRADLKSEFESRKLVTSPVEGYETGNSEYYQGKIGKHRVRLHLRLISKDGLLGGGYYYERVGVGINLSGRYLPSDKSFAFESWNSEGEEEYFYGARPSKDQIRGIWRQGDKVLSFELKRIHVLKKQTSKKDEHCNVTSWEFRGYHNQYERCHLDSGRFESSILTDSTGKQIMVDRLIGDWSIPNIGNRKKKRVQVYMDPMGLYLVDLESAGALVGQNVLLGPKALVKRGADPKWVRRMFTW